MNYVSRAKWINAIQQQQNFDEDIEVFYICKNHFTDDCLRKTKKSIVLKPGAFPTIFEKITHGSGEYTESVDEETFGVFEHVPPKSPEFNKFEQLSAKCIQMQLQHDVDKQDWDKKLQSVSDKYDEIKDNFAELKKTLTERENEIKNMKKELKQLRKRDDSGNVIIFIWGLLQELRLKNLCNLFYSQFPYEFLLHFYRSLFQDNHVEEVIDYLRNGKKKGIPYSEVIRMFCFKLHFFSPKAYDFVRSQFNDNLPHASTIQAWYRNSNLDSDAGISQTSLQILIKEAEKMKTNGQQLLCSLCFDEMAIRKHKQWCNKSNRFIGTVSYGKNDSEIANNALVFLINGLNAYIQVPVAYYFITSLTAEQRQQVLLTILCEFSKHEIITSNITYDGLPANRAMCELLGAKFKFNEITSFFIDPYSKRKIYIVLDPSHCIKLVRNNLANYGTIWNADGGEIQWEMLKKKSMLLTN